MKTIIDASFVQTVWCKNLKKQLKWNTIVLCYNEFKRMTAMKNSAA